MAVLVLFQGADQTLGQEDKGYCPPHIIWQCTAPSTKLASGQVFAFSELQLEDLSPKSSRTIRMTKVVKPRPAQIEISITLASLYARRRITPSAHIYSCKNLELQLLGHVKRLTLRTCDIQKEGGRSNV